MSKYIDLSVETNIGLSSMSDGSEKRTCKVSEGYEIVSPRSGRRLFIPKTNLMIGTLEKPTFIREVVAESNTYFKEERFNVYGGNAYYKDTNTIYELPIV